MLTAKDRDKKVTSLLKEIAGRARAGKPSVGRDYAALIEKLFRTGSWGFREILLVIIIARLLNQGYKASEALYECNPRALYEGPIRRWLIDNWIPHRQSGPLNIAKAAKAITSEWAAQRRPKDVASALVQIVKKIESESRTSVLALADFLCWRFLEEAREVKALDIPLDPLEDAFRIGDLCVRMIDEAPDGGNTPQRICGLLLDAYHQTLETGVDVIGYKDRASTTSTTSKKAGDITEVDSEGAIYSVIEVTTKPFGRQRVIEARDALRSFETSAGIVVREVQVLCRMGDMHPDAKDTGKSALGLGRVEHEGVTYLFVDVYEWIRATLIRIPPSGRKFFFTSINEYISDPSTAIEVKRAWRKLNSLA